MAPSILQACDLRQDESDRGKLHQVALYTVIMLQPCSVVCGEVPTGQTIGTRDIACQLHLIIRSLPLAHNAEHFTSIS